MKTLNKYNFYIFAGWILTGRYVYLVKIIRMKLNLVTDHELLINKGDALIISYSETPERFGLIIVCPECGEASSSKDQKHTYNKETQSYTPSIVHNKKLGGCGWHGWLTNGEFTQC